MRDFPGEQEICDYAGHQWEPAGGGLLICAVCMTERWADDAPAPREENDGAG